MKNDRSHQLFEEARKLIPGGVNSPVRSFKHVGIPPIYFSHAEGPYLFDVDGNRYVDFCSSFGPHIFGHSPPTVVKAIQEQAARATSFGACHPQEIELAQLILKGYSFLDQVRLVNSGTEAVMTGIRIARGYTRRTKILKFEGGYHGHSDGLLAQSGSGVAFLSESSSQGVPGSVVADTLVARFDDITTVRKVFETYGRDIAAVLLEPVPANYGLWLPPQEILEEIVFLARKHDALVFFDEVITGFRLGLSGASGMLGIKPDLVTLGKIIGGGLPLAAVAGRKAIMQTLAPQGEVYQAGTLSGNPLATAAGCAVLNQLFENPPYEHLASVTDRFADALCPILERQGFPFEVASLGSIFWIHFGTEQGAFPPVVSESSRELYASLFKFGLAEGIYLPPSPYEVGFISTMHTASVLQGVLDSLVAWKR